LWVVLLLQQVLAAYLRPNRMPYSEFKTAVAAGKVEEVAIGQTLIQGRTKHDAAAAGSGKPEQPPPDSRATLKDRNTFETVRVDDPELIRDLGKHGVKVNGVVESNFWRDAAGWIIPIAIIGAFWMLMIRRAARPATTAS
jgi:cell division protease FtsH